MRDAVNEFSNQDPSANIRLTRVPQAKLPCDPQLIRQVLWNLLNNAVRHSPPGAEIVVQSERAEGSVVICVRDSGDGVPAREQKRLFDKFFRGSGPSRDRKPGLGLGLYLARQVIEAHGGKIWYEAGEPKGARFCFSLPTDGSRQA